jgi:hypothetical protein
VSDSEEGIGSLKEAEERCQDVEARIPFEAGKPQCRNSRKGSRGLSIFLSLGWFANSPSEERGKV